MLDDLPPARLLESRPRLYKHRGKWLAMRKANFPSQYWKLPCFWTSHVNFAREKVPLSFHLQIGLASPLNNRRVSTLTPCPISQTDYHLLLTISNPYYVRHNSFPSNRPPSRYNLTSPLWAHLTFTPDKIFVTTRGLPNYWLIWAALSCW